MSGTYSFIDVSTPLTGPTGSTDLGYDPTGSGEGITVTMAETKNTMTIDADGEVTRSLYVGKSGTITVTLLRTSPVSKKLSLIYGTQGLSLATWGSNAIVIRNKVSSDTTIARPCTLQKQPDHANAKVGSTVSWIFNYGRVDQLFGEF